MKRGGSRSGRLGLGVLLAGLLSCRVGYLVTVEPCLADSDCLDEHECTIDSCVEGFCLHSPGDSLCDDGVYCNGPESCDPEEGCIGSENPCPSATECDEQADACVQCLDDGACNDGDDCTDDACLDGQCEYTPSSGTGEGPIGDPSCADLVDNDCDGQTDGDDQDCQSAGNRMLMVTRDGTFDFGDDLGMRDLFVGWGYEVTAIDRGATREDFASQAAVNDLIFISETTSFNFQTLDGAKVRELEIGIFDQASTYTLQWASTWAGGGSTHDSVNIVDSTHTITQGFAEGSLHICSGTNMYIGTSSTWAPGARVLARSLGNGNPTLVAFDTGAELFDSHLAPARRVSFLLSNVNVSLWNANMQELMQRALSWVARR